MDWTLISEGPWSKRRKHQAVVWNDQLLLLGGFDGESAFDLNDIWSFDGTDTWCQIADHAGWSGRDGHCAVVLNGSLFILGGTDDPYNCRCDVWRSEDGGFLWRQICSHAPWPARWQHAACVHDGKMYITGGWGDRYLNDVWCSSDGTKWIQVCSNAPWKSRMFHSAVSFNNMIYIIGGHDGRAQLRDVWASSDGGKVWTQVCQAAQWEGRQGHTCVAIDGYVYLMGGFGGSKRFNDMWKSKDCAHWTLVNQHCNWSPRQGHASIAFRGSIYMLGGFDEHGYCNSTYKYPISEDNMVVSEGNYENLSQLNDKSSSPNDSNKRASKVVTVSLTCALESIEKLKLRRIERERLTQKLILVVGLVMDAVHNRSSQHLQSFPSKDINIEEMNEKVVVDERQRSVSDAITSGKKGSPFRENFTEFGTATGRKAVPATSDADLRLQVWKLLSSSGKDDANDKDNNEINDNDIQIKASSASLRETMEQDRKTLRHIQASIRKAAESSALEQMEKLIMERTILANKAQKEANMLSQHISNVRKMQDSRSSRLECILSNLEDYFEDIGSSSTSSNSSSNDNDMMQCTWNEWEVIARSCADIVAKLNTGAAEEAITLLNNEFKSEMRVTNEISEWMMSNNSDLLNSNDDFNSSNLLKYEKLAQEYDEIQDSLDKCRMAVKTAVDNELTQIFILENEIKDMFKVALCKGSAMVKNLISQNSLDIMEISAMESELVQWNKTVSIIASREELQKECDSYVKEKDDKEDELLKLEDKRIDIRSELEKATLKAQRNNTRIKPEESPKPDTENEIEKIRENLSVAEKDVKEMRKAMRSWFRNLRRRSMEYIPELFHYLPDLQAPGSVLGDGGFAENAKLPRRRLEEYDDVEPLIVNDSVNGEKKCNGRHVLLKASYDGEEVVLKGFVVNEDAQRRGLERELSILGRLRNDSIITPGAIVEDVGTLSSRFQVTVYIEYPYCKGGNLFNWLKAQPRKPWELQAIARQLLYGIMYLHDHGVIHKDIKPSNVLLHEDGRVVLADFELSREVQSKENGEEEVSTTTRSGTLGFMSPEVESGGSAVFASDMYSFGVMIFYMHFPTEMANLIPGNPRIPPNNDADLVDLLKRLLAINATQRPSAASALMHPYFRSTFVERMMQDGEVVEQDRKLDAVRNLLHRARSENRTNLERITVHRDNIVEEVLQYFSEMKLEKLRASLRVTFIGEPGVDEGGLLTEMFTIFFESILGGEKDIFSSSENAAGEETKDDATIKNANSIVLPSAVQTNEDCLRKLRSFGRAMVKALYEGRRIGSRLCPSVFKFITATVPDMRDLQMYDPQTARSLQWALATVGVEEFGLHFESVGDPESGPVTDFNKSRFVRMKIENILVKSRQPQLLAIKAGFVEALKALSEEAAPFMSLLSHADWRVLLCGDSAISGPQVISVLKFSGFPKKSSIPQWLKEILIASSEDHLRKFLVFVTGSPSLSSSSRDEINVRYQARSGALPVAHTCFFHLDIPDYRDKETLQSKLMYAMSHATTFEVV